MRSRLTKIGWRHEGGEGMSDPVGGSAPCIYVNVPAWHMLASLLPVSLTPAMLAQLDSILPLNVAVRVILRALSDPRRSFQCLPAGWVIQSSAAKPVPSDPAAIGEPKAVDMFQSGLFDGRDAATLNICKPEKRRACSGA